MPRKSQRGFGGEAPDGDAGGGFSTDAGIGRVARGRVVRGRVAEDVVRDGGKLGVTRIEACFPRGTLAESRQAMYDRFYPPFLAGAKAGKLCTCQLCWPYYAWAGLELPQADEKRWCKCGVCGQAEEAAGAMQCVCPLCTPWTWSGGSLLMAPMARSLETLTKENREIGTTLGERRKRQAALQNRAIELTEGYFDLAAFAIERAKKDPAMYLKMALKAGEGVSRLALPVGWEKETDAGGVTAALRELKGAMSEYREIIREQMQAAEKGIELPTLVMGRGGDEGEGK